jgi:HEAT repeat protein
MGLVSAMPIFAVPASADDSLGGAQQEQLLSRLASGDEEQRLEALAQLGATLPTAGDAFKTQAIAALGNSLQRDQSPVIRAFAAGTLEISGDDRAVPMLLAQIGQERELAVRKAIIYALARYPLSQVTRTLITLLNDRKHEIRGAAAYAIAEIGDTSAAQPLIEFMRKRGKDDDAFARSQAARALGRLGSRDAIGRLVDALTKDKSQSVRREAADALGKIATTQDVIVIESLRAARHSSDPYLTIAANQAIASINSRTP